MLLTFQWHLFHSNNTHSLVTVNILEYCGECTTVTNSIMFLKFAKSRIFEKSEILVEACGCLIILHLGGVALLIRGGFWTLRPPLLLWHLLKHHDCAWLLTLLYTNRCHVTSAKEAMFSVLFPFISITKIYQDNAICCRGVACTFRGRILDRGLLSQTAHLSVGLYKIYHADFQKIGWKMGQERRKKE